MGLFCTEEPPSAAALQLAIIEVEPITEFTRNFLRVDILNDLWAVKIRPEMNITVSKKNSRIANALCKRLCINSKTIGTLFTINLRTKYIEDVQELSDYGLAKPGT